MKCGRMRGMVVGEGGRSSGVLLYHQHPKERCGSVVLSMPAWHAGGRDSIPARTRHVIIWCNNLALNIRDCVSLCLSDETLKAVGPFNLVSMPGEVKYPTQGANV